MRTFLKLIKDEFVFYTLILSLFLWGFSSSLYLIFKEDRSFVIEKDSQGFLKILGTKDLSSRREVFLRLFVILSFNYDTSSFKKNLSMAGELMSDEFWRKKRAYFLKVFEEVRMKKISQFAEISKLIETSNNTYKAHLNIIIFQGKQKTEKKGKLLIKLQSAEMRAQNLYGFEVYDVQIL